ncbi:hypothetical protein [Coxiella endosymbiont of Ornithodoros amblus]|uniref:hypothetical protein n=1 Tax=Coxiella endosymbiont of Ornithodoros amblus TaxID=1656166 RepID=UPI00244DECB1|nr:hypothetical protein [Coxiella endosymbiont of Ornithodoros amblus]
MPVKKWRISKSSSKTGSIGLIKAAVVRVKNSKILMKFEIDYQMSFDSLNSEVKNY